MTSTNGGVSLAKRPRACDACHAIKIKCELGSKGGVPPCQRCMRLEKHCLVTPPKRQKDRVAELEAQVEALTRLLESQNIQVPSSDSQAASPDTDLSPQHEGPEAVASAPITTLSSAITHKKRRLEGGSTGERFSNLNSSPRIELDTVVVPELQKQIVDRYRDQMFPVFPLIPTADYDTLRKSQPLLLQAVIYAASHSVLALDTQEEVARIVMDSFAKAALADGQKPLELVQALQITIFWYTTPRHHTKVEALHIPDLAAGIAEELGIGGSDCTTLLASSPANPTISTADSWRTWLVCYCLSACMSMFMRRPNRMSWNEHEENSILMMGYSEHVLASDRLAGQIIRAEYLCERVASTCNLWNFDIATDVADAATQSTMRSLQNQITDWKAQIPSDLRRSTLTVWEHAAALYLHESVLHTPTNKRAFTAPFIAEKLSVADFPAPVVTPEHVSSIHALRYACQALLDFFMAMDIPTLMLLPGLVFASRVAYAQYILVRLFVATSAHGNTFGAYLDPNTLQVEDYLQKLLKVAGDVGRSDKSSGQAKVLLHATPRLCEWITNYKTTHLGIPPESVDNGIQALANPLNEIYQTEQVIPADWYNAGFGGDVWDMGLSDLFADPMVDWYPATTANGSAVPNDNLVSNWNAS